MSNWTFKNKKHETKLERKRGREVTVTRLIRTDMDETLKDGLFTQNEVTIVIT